MATDSMEPGRVLAGRYKLESRLGEGGFGTIWRAEHLVLAAPVAVKLVDTDVVKDEEQVDRFLREARAAAALRSPHVVQIIDYGVDGDVPFMVMELLEGETLAHRVRGKGKLTPAETGRILTHVGRAMAKAHAAGIVHRDLKPENVFLVHNEDEEIAKVLDFGVAKVETTNIAKQGAKTRTGSLLGTPYYMSPEQAQGNKEVDHRSDLWSLGVIAFECLTGKRPFHSDGLGELVLQICAYPIPLPSEVGSVPLGFDAWFKRATERDPKHRFQSAKDLTESLREVLGLEARDASMLPDVNISVTFDDDDERSTAEVNPGDSAAQARKAEGEARTIQARPEEGPALTVRQFGTTQRTAPAPRKSGGSGLVLIVAGASIAVGLAVGFAVLNKRMRKVESPPAATTTEVTAPAAAPPLEETEQTSPLAPEATLVPPASASAPASSSALHPLARPDQHGGKSDKTRKDTAKDEKLDPNVMLDRPPKPAADAGAHAPKDEPAPPAPPLPGP
jgi:serine/threonine-protein kinase